MLLARDPLAPFLVSIWSSLRNGDFEAANVKFDAMLGRAALQYGPAPDVDKANEALDCAFAMFDWAGARAARERAAIGQGARTGADA